MNVMGSGFGFPQLNTFQPGPVPVGEAVDEPVYEPPSESGNEAVVGVDATEFRKFQKSALTSAVQHWTIWPRPSKNSGWCNHCCRQCSKHHCSNWLTT